MNSVLDLMKIAFHDVGIVEIWMWTCQESCVNQLHPNRASLSSKLKWCQYDYHSSPNFRLLVDLLEEYACQIHITCVHIIRCENKFNHDFINNCLIKVAMEKCLLEFSLKLSENKNVIQMTIHSFIHLIRILIG